MTTHSPEVTYAYALLGLEFGAPLEDIEDVVKHARAYRYATQPRIREVERFVEFFMARDKLGDIHTPFAFIRRAYHKKAMMLHPDRTGNKVSEEQLKLINTAFGIVDAVHREARDYYRQSDATRTEIEDEARATTERETPPDVRAIRKRRAEHAKRKHRDEARRAAHSAAHQPEPAREWEAPSRPVLRYVAASIPRFIRTARLSHVPINHVIGSWHVVQRDGSFFIYDILMLPEREFLRARMQLSTPVIASPALQRGGFAPTYIPKDIKAVTVPEGEVNPVMFARNYFLKEFGVLGN